MGELILAHNGSLTTCSPGEISGMATACQNAGIINAGPQFGRASGQLQSDGRRFVVVLPSRSEVPEVSDLGPVSAAFRFTTKALRDGSGLAYRNLRIPTQIAR